MFRTIKAIRSIKIINFMFIGANALLKIKYLIQRMFICIPLVIQLMPVIFILYYVYSIIGMEFMNWETSEIREGGPFTLYEYADFTSFGGALLILF